MSERDAYREDVLGEAKRWIWVHFAMGVATGFMLAMALCMVIRQ